MRFFTTTVLALLAQGAHGTSYSHENLNNMLSNGKINKQEILSKAIPVDERKLSNYAANYNSNNGGNNYNQNGGNNGGNNYKNNNGGNYGNGNNVNGNNYRNPNNYANYNYNFGKNQGGYAYWKANYQNKNNQGYNQYGANGGQYNANGQNYTNYFNNGWENWNQDALEQDTDYLKSLGLSGNTTIRFNKCLSYAVQDPALVYDDTLSYYASQGTIVAQQSYVLIDVQECQPGECVFDESDTSKIFMIPLSSFVETMLEYKPTKNYNYCEQCSNHFSYCQNGNGRYYDEQTYSNGGTFCYQGTRYEMINCHKCSSQFCFGSGYEYYLDGTSEWVEELVECKETGTSWNNLDLYTGLMCNQAGDGIEFGVFVDNECKYYHTKKAASAVLQEDEWRYYYKMPSHVDFMFSNSISCYDEKEIAYMNAYQPIYADDDGTCTLGDNINDSCYNLFSLYSIQLSTCEMSTYYLGRNQNNDEGDENDNQNQNKNQNRNQNDGNYYFSWMNNDGDYSQYSQYNVDYKWKSAGLYDYDMTYEDSQDPAAVCTAITKTYSTHKHKNIDTSHTAGFWNFFSHSSSAEKDADSKQNSWYVEAPMSTGEKIWWWSFALLCGFVAGYAAYRLWSSSRPTTIIVEEVVESKKDVPLMT